MPETRQPSKDKQEAFEAFKKKYNLDPLNNDAIMNCLFELNEKMNEMSKYITVYAKEKDFTIAGMKHEGYVSSHSLYDLWNK